MNGRRKREHLEICLNEDVASAATTGLERYRLTHCALPEMAFAEVDTTTCFLGHTLRAPLLISAMTGGTPLARDVNQRLAMAAQALGLAMGVGSQRSAIEGPESLGTYRVREVAPDILLLANLGAVQLNYGYGVEACLSAVTSIGADALVLHLNPLQEVLQPEGDTDFRGLIARIGAVCAALPVPVIVKEVGWGLSAEVALALQAAGVAALDIAGAGGTSWSEVERHRSLSPADAEVALAFRDWGLPTAESLLAVRRACPELPLIASGGLRTGVDVAKCLALGADLTGLACPLLRAAAQSAEVARERLEIIVRQLRVAMFASGARSVSALDATHLLTREALPHDE